MSSTTGVDLSLSGLASGFDWKTLVSQLANVERAPEQQLQAQQSTINQENATWGNVKSLLTTLQTNVDALKDPTLFDSRTAQVADPTVASASVTTGAPLGNYTFNLTQLATAAQQVGTSILAARSAPPTVSPPWSPPPPPLPPPCRPARSPSMDTR